LGREAAADLASKTALITGITGQDGSYLAELLLEQGYRVVGMTRRTSTEVHERIEHIVDRVEIVSGDLLDQSSMTNLIDEIRPHEVYNLAAQSFVPTSWAQPVLTGEFTALGVTRVLEAIRQVNPRIRFYQASSSEMFGKVVETPQNESTPFYPRSPYGVAKVYGHWITINYRESYDLFAVSGILFNHESERRGKEFVTRKISDGVARINTGSRASCGSATSTRARLGLRGRLRAGDVADAAAQTPDDYVIATGRTHSVREFCRLAFAVDLDYEALRRAGSAFLCVPPKSICSIGDPSRRRSACSAGTRRRASKTWSR
jgi:GDPmannose 4,6-dehydratase